MLTTIIIRWEKALKDACQQLNGDFNAPNYSLNLGSSMTGTCRLKIFEWTHGSLLVRVHNQNVVGWRLVLN